MLLKTKVKYPYKKELKSMSCGKNNGRHDENCVCDAVDKILA
ncbi:spore coat protein, partial [Bacillus paralicheniformis]|nr:spore coat protein [Bacillus paralicheniformis]